MEKTDFYKLTRGELEEYLSSNSSSKNHAKSLFREAYKKLASAPWQDSTLPKSLIDAFGEKFTTSPLSIAHFELSAYDQSVKFSMRTNDGYLIETVLIPEKTRITVCVSSQVGCAQNCSFCATGRMGLKRNLSAGEIVAQIVTVNQWIKVHTEWLSNRYPSLRRKVSNVVFMGMGEPLDNVENLIAAIAILVDPLGLGIGLRKISISTAGYLSGLDRLLEVFPQIPIALSLHASTNALRKKIMPITERWNLDALLQTVKKINEKQKQDVLIQYTLIAGINDSLQDAEILSAILQGLNVKINLIPFNEVNGSMFRRPDENQVYAFKDYLHHKGFRTLVRHSKGRDIQGACGQLFKKVVDA